MGIPHIHNVSESLRFRELAKERIKLSGFNNLTKILSFNLYDFCITLDEKQKLEYAQYINEKYSASRIVDISKRICEIIEANILNVSMQDYDPVGASSMVLMSDIKGGKWDEMPLPLSAPPLAAPRVSMHLDKSHITAHTYPDTSDMNGIATFRVDIDIATCGEIIPLSAINYLFQSFECDVVVIDYVVRGYTRLEDGSKIFNDHTFNSIQDFISPDILKFFSTKADINLPNNNIWQTKLMITDELGPEHYLLHLKDQYSADPILLKDKMKILRSEMKEIFHLIC